MALTRGYARFGSGDLCKEMSVTCDSCHRQAPHLSFHDGTAHCKACFTLTQIHKLLFQIPETHPAWNEVGRIITRTIREIRALDPHQRPVFPFYQQHSQAPPGTPEEPNRRAIPAPTTPKAAITKTRPQPPPARLDTINEDSYGMEDPFAVYRAHDRQLEQQHSPPFPPPPRENESQGPHTDAFLATVPLLPVEEFPNPFPARINMQLPPPKRRKTEPKAPGRYIPTREC